jgi:hypothetical protein
LRGAEGDAAIHEPMAALADSPVHGLLRLRLAMTKELTMTLLLAKARP